MIEVGSLHHITILTRDMAKAKWFYGEVLGLPVIRAGSDTGIWYGLGTDQQLHLNLDRTGNAQRPRFLFDQHFALRIRSYRQARETLSAHGIPMEERPNHFTGWHHIYCWDPDENLIELHSEVLDI